MYKYRYIGDSPQVIPSHGLEVQPGDEITVEEPINHPDFELIKDERPKKKGVDE